MEQRVFTVVVFLLVLSLLGITAFFAVEAVRWQNNFNTIALNCNEQVNYYRGALGECCPGRLDPFVSVEPGEPMLDDLNLLSGAV